MIDLGAESGEGRKKSPQVPKDSRISGQQISVKQDGSELGMWEEMTQKIRSSAQRVECNSEYRVETIDSPMT